MSTTHVGTALILGAVLLDRLIGDPSWLLHPVVVMGWWIQRLRRCAEDWAGDQPFRLRLSGGVITLTLVLGSGSVGWCLERLIWLPAPWPWFGNLVLTIGLASALAARSLAVSVRSVLEALPSEATADLTPARQKLAWIVGRDVERLDEAGILRAAAETASENAVDGIFAPLFWMGIGLLIWAFVPTGPGPLALAWAFKASSTLDSMLGYKHGRLGWLGTAGARLDDLLTWLPCRLVMLTLPLVSRPWTSWFALVSAAERDGASDPSPNAREVVPHPPQSGKQILELREFDLHPCLSRAGTCGKNVENQLRTIHDSNGEQVLEILSLSGRQLFVENHEVRSLLLDEVGQCPSLAFTQIELRVWRAESLNERPRDLTSGRVGQPREFPKMFVCHVPRLGPRRRADKYGPVDGRPEIDELRGDPITSVRIERTRWRNSIEYRRSVSPHRVGSPTTSALPPPPKPL